MAMNDQQIIAVINRILAREGGYSNDPNDRGHETNFGITQAVANDFNAGDVRLLTRVQAVMIYRTLFTNWGITAIPDEATFGLVADCCVNHGARRGIKWLQHGIGMSDAETDGVIGPHTKSVIAGVTASEWPGVYAIILASRIKFYAEILDRERKSNPDRPLKDSQVKFIAGWVNRACEFIR